MMKKMFLGCTSALLAVSIALVGCSSTNESEVSSKEQKGSEQKGSAPVGELVHYQVTGIEPGSGIHRLTEQSFKDYQLKDWKLMESSSAAMLATLKKAVDNKEPIVVTGWTPHWMMQKFDLKFLDDPKGSFGKPEDIHTLTRLGFEQEHPNAYKLLQQFKWESDNLAEVMSMIENGLKPAEAAEKWMNEHKDIVDRWYAGVEQGNGEEISLVHVSWTDNIADTYVAAQALKSKGYSVKITQVDAAPAYAGVASSTADIFVGAILPNTHGEYYNKFKDKLVDVGTNLEGMVMGLAVPKYMEDIRSIEDLGK